MPQKTPVQDASSRVYAHRLFQSNPVGILKNGEVIRTEQRRRPLSYTLDDLTRLIAKHNFCVLATQGLRGPHVVGVSYFARGLDLYILTSAKTVKARNVRRDPRVAVHIPVPWPLVPAPMKSIQFRGSAEILPIDDPDASEALEHGSFVMRRVMRRLLRNVDAKVWGESVWIHVHPRKRIETFMIGVPPTTIFRDEAKAILHFEVS